MKSALLTKAIMYLLMGILFTILATGSAGENIWNITTIILMIVATLSFLAFFRFLFKYMSMRNNNKI